MDGSTRSTKRVVVLGDPVVDTWIHTVSTRNSQDTKEPIIHSLNYEYSDGGALNVKKHLGILLVPNEAYFNDSSIPNKTRIVVNNKVILRYDTCDKCLPSTKLSSVIWKDIDSVVIADYAKGSITPEIIRWLWLHRDKYRYLFVDTKQDPSLWTDLRDKAIFFPNTKEYLAHKNVYDCMRYVVVKEGPRGARVLKYGDQICEFTPEPVETLNTCGAGDAFMAAFVASVLKQNTFGVRDWQEALVDSCEYVRGRLLENTDIPRTI